MRALTEISALPTAHVQPTPASHQSAPYPLRIPRGRRRFCYRCTQVAARLTGEDLRPVPVALDAASL